MGKPALRPAGRAPVASVSQTGLSAPPVGYEPSELDGTLRSYLAVVERNIRHAESLGKQVESCVTRLASAPEGPDAFDDANKATSLFERLTKAGLNLVKATDELSRLRSFLAGGPDSRPDLTVRGEVELRGLLVTAVRQLGWRIVNQKGDFIDAEEVSA